MNLNYNYLPQPVKSWPEEEQYQFLTEYNKEFSNLRREETNGYLQAWGFSIPSIGLTAVITTIIAVAGAALSPPLSVGLLIAVICIAVATAGTSTSVIGGLYIASQAEKYADERATLNHTLMLAHLEKRNDQPTAQTTAQTTAQNYV